MRRFCLTVVLAVVGSVFLPAGGAAGLGGPPKLPRDWSHAEINVRIKGVAHTLIYDYGRVTSVSASSLTLKERDGSVVEIDISPNATIKLNGRTATLSVLRVGLTAQTLRIDGGPATRVQAYGRVARPIPKQVDSGKLGGPAKQASKATTGRGR